MAIAGAGLNGPRLSREHRLNMQLHKHLVFGASSLPAQREVNYPFTGRNYQRLHGSPPIPPCDFALSNKSLHYNKITQIWGRITGNGEPDTGRAYLEVDHYWSSGHCVLNQSLFPNHLHGIIEDARHDGEVEQGLFLCR
jgi:hypothetical protein